MYDSDSYSDDLPYWEKRGKKKQLIVPYTLDNNDMRFATNQGFKEEECWKVHRSSRQIKAKKKVKAFLSCRQKRGK